MLEILQFYVSGFWVWLGLTIGISAVAQTVVLTMRAILGRR